MSERESGDPGVALIVGAGVATGSAIARRFAREVHFAPAMRRVRLRPSHADLSWNNRRRSLRSL